MRCCRFYFEANLWQAGPYSKENLNPLADSPLVTPGRMTWHFLPCVSISGHTWGFPRPNTGALQAQGCAGQPPSGCTLHEVWVAPAVPLVPLKPLSSTAASLCPRPSRCRHQVLQPQHPHSPLGVKAALTAPGCTLAVYHRIALSPVETCSLREVGTRLGSGCHQERWWPSHTNLE